jgi:riboflavin kinase/FMN adenylyltransferase
MFNMQVHQNIEALPSFRNAVITIGTFDGVHTGHRQIIEKMQEEARQINGETVIITFHPHPRSVIASKSPVRLINTLEEKIELLTQLGIDHLVVVPFTDQFADQDAADYVREFLVQQFSPHTIIIGYDHRFGKGRKGDYILLEELAPVYQYQLREIPKHVLDEIGISSTKIREALSNGQVEVASRLLGYPFFFSGTVMHGDKIGRQLGYPTANIKLSDEEKIIPADGIYAVTAALQSEPAETFDGMMSIGFRPTVNGTKRVIEVNLFDFDDDIYEETLRVFPRKYLRPEVKFESLEKLVEQIDADKKQSLDFLKSLRD